LLALAEGSGALFSFDFFSVEVCFLVTPEPHREISPSSQGLFYSSPFFSGSKGFLWWSWGAAL